MIRSRRRFQSDDEVFEDLVRTNARAVRTYAFSIASSTTVAEDAVQETFLRAWRYLDTFRGSGSREGWLLRICRNAVYDLAARERRSSPGTNVVRLDQPQQGDWVASGSDDGGTAFALDVIELVNELPLAQREVLVLCRLLGHSYESAADILDLPVGTVRSRLSRARRALADSLVVGPSEVA